MMKLYKIIFSACFLFTFGLSAEAQNYNMSNGTPVTTCSGNFYDNGGSGGNHADAGTFTQTFTSADGNRLRFAFSSFNTAGGSDILRIYDGPDNTYPLIRSASGGAGAFTVESTGSQLTFVFSTFTNGLTAAGWAATISCTTPALTSYNMTSGTTTACSGVFYDNGGPTANYSDNEDRVMTFCSGTTDFLQFDFTQATISGNDSLYIYDGNSTAATPIAIFTSGSRFETFTSTGTCITFRFKSDASGNSTGWQVIFQCVSTPQAPTNYSISNSVIYTCSGKFYDDGGTGNHGDGGNYTQTFYSNNGNRLKFDFTSFSTAGSSDIVRIYDGPDNTYPLLRTVSGSAGAFIVESTGSSLTFNFSMFTNGITAAGWVADISCTTPTLTNYSMTSGTVTSCSGVFYDNGGATANYPNNEDRVMTFCSGTTDFLQFDFTQATLSGNDSLYVYDGNSTAATPIAVFTSGSRFETFTSTGTCVTFRFRSDASGNSTGWQAIFQCVNTTQSPTNYSISNSVIYTCSGKFYDDGGTGNHGDGGSYTQTFYSSNGNRLKFDFTSFNTAGASDILRIYDGPNNTYPLLRTVSGSNGAFIVESTGSSLTFNFSMFTNGITAAGWVADISCTTPTLTNYPMTSGTVNTCSGVFYDNGAGTANYPNNEDRIQTFCSDNGEYLIFDFTHFNISAEDTLYAYDGSSTSAPLMGIYTGDQLPEKIYSKSGTCVTFKFISSAATNSMGWRALLSCSSTAPSQVFNMQTGIRYTCGGTFYDDGGSGGNYSNSFNKTMTFVSDAGNGCGIKVTFSAFNTQSASDILYLYDGMSTADPLLGSFSGTSLPGGVSGIQSTGNSITFRFVSGAATNAAGWTAAMSCPNQPGIPPITTNSPVCGGNALQLSTNTVAGGTYSWSGPNGFTSTDEDPSILNVTTAASGQYTLTLTKDGCISQGTANVVINTVPSAPVAGSNSPVCENGALDLTASAITNAAYLWTGPDGFTSTQQNPSITNVTAAKAGTYSVTATVDGCESAASTVNVVINSVGAISAGNDGPSYCAGTTVNLSVNTIAGASYSWSGPNGFSSTDQNPVIVSATTAATGTYTVIATVGSCSKQSVTNITVNTAPAIPTAGSNGPICAGNSLNLTATAISGASYSWSGPDGFTSSDQNPIIAVATTAASGAYTVVATIGSCSEQDDVTVTVNTSPAIPTAGNNGPLCEGQNLNLTAATIAGATYSWSGPNGFTSTDEDPSIVGVTTAATGTYTVTATIGSCANQSTTNVIVSAAPVATAGSNSPICEGSILSLTANTVAGATYSWSGPNGFTSTDEDPSVSGITSSQAGTYTVMISIGSCSDQDDVSVTVNTVPSAPVAGSNSPLCVGDILNLTASTVAGATYSWTGPNGFSSTNQNPTRSGLTLADDGTYSVQANVGGCQSVAATVEVNISTISSVTASNTGPYCIGETIMLNVNTTANATYSWSGPNGFTSNDQNPTIANAAAVAAGTYTVTVSIGSCSQQNTTNVGINSGPVIPTITFNSFPDRLISSSFFDNQWNKDGVPMFGETGSNLLLFTPGVYTVTVTGSNGCTSTSAPYNYGVTSTASNSYSIARIEAYPNPSEGVFTIATENLNENILNLKIRNSHGLEVATEEYQISNGSFSTKCDLRNFAKGVYYLHFDTGYNKTVLKIVVQ